MGDVVLLDPWLSESGQRDLVAHLAGVDGLHLLARVDAAEHPGLRLQVRGLASFRVPNVPADFCEPSVVRYSAR